MPTGLTRQARSGEVQLAVDTPVAAPSRPQAPSARRPSLLARPLTQLVASMRARELSPVDLVEVHIRRMEAVNPVLNALTADRFEDALREAREAEAEYASADASVRHTRPLLGVPFTAKEMIELEGMPLTFGSIARRGRRGVRDATVIARLRSAGAIPLGVTNMPEWGMWFESYNDIHGRTSNPFDVRHTPGGSSGGEGAAVGSGASVFGIGSDIGGSVRMPAAFCGVFGHKPTTGLLPLTGHYPVYADGPDAKLRKEAPYASIGTLTRSAADIAALMRVMAGRDGIDPNAEPIAFHDPMQVDWRGRRVLLLGNPRIRRASAAAPELTNAVDRAGHLLADRGAYVSQAPDALLRHAGDIWSGALQAVGGPSFAGILSGGRGFHLGFEVLRTLAGAGRYSWPALIFCIGERIGHSNQQQLRAALREGRRLTRKFRDLIGEGGVLVSPVHPHTAPRHNAPMLHPFDFLYTAVFNALRIPATTAPCGFDARGLPLAVQFTSMRGNDHLTIAAAAVVEADTPPWHPARVRGE